MKLLEILKFTGQYFKWKNKTLWSGSSGSWVSGTKNIPGISKYTTLKVGCDLAYSSHIALKENDTTFAVNASITYPTWAATQRLVLRIDANDNVTIIQNNIISHQPDQHISTSGYGIFSIVGLEPDIKNLWGGVTPRKHPLFLRGCLEC